DSRRGKMIPLGCNMYVVLKVQNGNGSRLVIVFLLLNSEEYQLRLPAYWICNIMGTLKNRKE
ncbi:MAG: hypothetical protein KH214_12075, partial [Ruminococcus sp.]|nr:hypothetical protein [Ruminococcus sp.]